ncbi:hypothetical protein QQ045_007100 [Rhodiola kirilowii]
MRLTDSPLQMSVIGVGERGYDGGEGPAYVEEEEEEEEEEEVMEDEDELRLKYQRMGGNMVLEQPVSLELGGKIPIVVFDDVDLDQAAEWTAFGCFWTNGQICSATSRLLVHISKLSMIPVVCVMEWIMNNKHYSSGVQQQALL